MDFEMEADSNPLFGSSGGFKPSLTAITEDDRETSSYFRDGASNRENKHSSVSTRTSEAPRAGKTAARKELPQDSPTKQTGNEKRTNQLPRLPSLSRLIRTKSGRVLRPTDMEEKEEEDGEGAAASIQKKRASILNLFKTAPAPSS
jgi:hypothetical protein